MSNPLTSLYLIRVTQYLQTINNPFTIEFDRQILISGFPINGISTDIEIFHEYVGGTIYNQILIPISVNLNDIQRINHSVNNKYPNGKIDNIAISDQGILAFRIFQKMKNKKISLSNAQKILSELSTVVSFVETFVFHKSINN